MASVTNANRIAKNELPASTLAILYFLRSFFFSFENASVALDTSEATLQPSEAILANRPPVDTKLSTLDGTICPILLSMLARVDFPKPNLVASDGNIAGRLRSCVAKSKSDVATCRLHLHIGQLSCSFSRMARSHSASCNSAGNHKYCRCLRQITSARNSGHLNWKFSSIVARLYLLLSRSPTISICNSVSPSSS